jgi:two-component system chemotaxis response regulator CheB
VGEAENGAAALSMIPDLAPHVVTLDINMPVMDGLTALKHIMIRHPRPTVMCSTLTREGRKMTFDTLKFGAVDFIHKPSNRLASSLEAQYQAIIDKVTLASAVDMDALRFLKTGKNGGAADTAVRPKHLAHVCAVGASEGGYGALLRIVPFLRRDLPVAFLMIIHDDAANVAAFTRYLKHESAIRVQRAVDGAPVKPGVCYVASGAEYMTLSGRGRGYGLRLHDTPFPGRRGGINMLMLSLAEVMKARAAGLILSGGGNDGAEGLREIERRGGFAMVQAPAASLYKEMPRSALKETLQATALPDHAAAKALNRRWGLPGAAPSAC